MKDNGINTGFDLGQDFTEAGTPMMQQPVQQHQDLGCPKLAEEKIRQQQMQQQQM